MKNANPSSVKATFVEARGAVVISIAGPRCRDERPGL